MSQMRENWQKFTFKIRIWNFNENHVRDMYFFFHCKNSFLFNTVVSFFFHCLNSLSSILALLSFYHCNFFFDVRTQLLFLFFFFLNFLLHRPLSRIHFIPWISVFLTLCSILHGIHESFFFFAFLRYEFEYPYLNFLPRKTKK